MTTTVLLSPLREGLPEKHSPVTWHDLDHGLQRIGRDWAVIYRGTQDLACITCGHPTRLIVSYSPRASLAICGSCRGY